MKIEPELVDHPKFLRLKKRVGDLAMEYLHRLWGHCQRARHGEFWKGADAAYVEMVCHWDGNEGELLSALCDTNWIKTNKRGLIIHDWESHNPHIVANWNNGKSGGRPHNPKRTRSKPNGNPSETHGLPNENPTKTQREPSLTKQNITKHNVTEHNEAKRNDREEGGTGETPDASVVPPQPPPPSPPDPNGNEPLAKILAPTWLQAQACLEFLNKKTGGNFRQTHAVLHLIATRLQEVGGDLAGVQAMIARQTTLWQNDPKCKNFLRPATLFGEHFDDYYGQRTWAAAAVNSEARACRLQALIDKSPANSQSAYHNQHPTQEQKDQLSAWSQELRALASAGRPGKGGGIEH